MVNLDRARCLSNKIVNFICGGNASIQACRLLIQKTWDSPVEAKKNSKF